MPSRSQSRWKVVTVESGRRLRVLELATHRRGEALVEADQQRPITLGGQCTCLLGGEQRLAAAGRPHDLQPAHRARGVQDPRLRAAGRDELHAVVSDATADEPPERNGRAEELVEEGHALRTGRSLAAGAIPGPVGEGPVEPTSRSLVRLECRRVEDEVRRFVEPEKHMASRQARKVDVRERDRVPDHGVQVDRPIGEVHELVVEDVRTRARLFERGHGERVTADVPPPLMVT